MATEYEASHELTSRKDGSHWSTTGYGSKESAERAKVSLEAAGYEVMPILKLKNGKSVNMGAQLNIQARKDARIKRPKGER